MSVTIEDIAKEAHVSKATVSRVLNHTKSVSPELYKRVERVIHKNHYKPNALARSLVTSKTNTIGIVVSDISNPVFGALTKGINHYCESRDYTLLVCESGGIREKEIELLQKLADKKIDGVLFAGVNVDQNLVSYMNALEYPVVLVTNEASYAKDVIPTVVHDNTSAIRDAVTFLINHGHEKIAFILGPKDDYSSVVKRVKSYKETLKKSGIPVNENYIAYGKFTFESGYNSMKALYEENEDMPTAVMAASDLLAIGAMSFLKSVQIRVPEDISVMGFDDSELAMYSSPALSTVRISYFEEGEMAAKRLFELIGDETGSRDNSTSYVGYKIIRRASVKQIS